MTASVQERVQGLQRSLALVERWQRDRGGGDFTDALDQSSIELSGLVRDFAVGDLRTLAADGHRAVLQVSRAGWTARIVVEPRKSFLIDEVTGPLDEAFPDQQKIDDVQAARDEDRAEALLQLSEGLHCRARVTLQVRPAEAGFHWFRTADALLLHVEQHTWLGLVRGIYSTPAPRRLVIQDVGSESVSAPDLVVHGTDVYPADPPGVDSSAWREYAETWLHDDRSDLPAPIAVLPREAQGLTEIPSVLRGMAHGLSWLWLASSANITGRAVAVRFEALPDLGFDLTRPPNPDHSEQAVRLWEWAVASTDPARREALQQAVSLVVRESAALERSPERVLRTSKYLLRLSQQGAVAEALAIRRTARQAAIDAARASADASRSASRGVVDRVLTQLVGAFGVLLANQGNLVNTPVAGWLLWAILALTAATAIVAFVFEYPAASGLLKAFEQDLDDYSDTLIREDIAHIKGMKSLRAAQDQLSRARWVSGVLLLAAAFALVIARSAWLRQPSVLFPGA